MEIISILPAFLSAIIIFAAPILIPIFLKRWLCLTVVMCGNIIYFSFLYYLSQTSDVSEFGTPMAVLYLPISAVTFIIGLILDRPSREDKSSNN